jgi:hypothetical protein
MIGIPGVYDYSGMRSGKTNQKNQKGTVFPKVQMFFR